MIEQYRKYLANYKKKNYATAPASTEEYVHFWEDALVKDLEESVKDGGFQMHFYPFHRDGHFLVLDKYGKLPEKYQSKFDAYPYYGKEVGLDVLVDSDDDGNGGVIYSVLVSRPTGVIL